MREGYWINYENGAVLEVDEHEMWIRDVRNARRLGLAETLLDDFARFRPKADRVAFLSHLLRNAPILRVRGHGERVTFEYDVTGAEKQATVFRVMQGFCETIGLGPQMGLVIVNLGDPATPWVGNVAEFKVWEAPRERSGRFGPARPGRRAVPLAPGGPLQNVGHGPVLLGNVEGRAAVEALDEPLRVTVDHHKHVTGRAFDDVAN